MTTLAYTGGVLAADSAITGGGTYYGSVRKLERRKDGWLAGAAGSAATCRVFLDWFLRADGAPLNVASGELDALMIAPDETVYFVDKHGMPVEITATHHAAGSGATHALAAMECGKTAVEAVKIACKFDLASRGPIRSVRL